MPCGPERPTPRRESNERKLPRMTKPTRAPAYHAFLLVLLTLCAAVTAQRAEEQPDSAAAAAAGAPSTAPARTRKPPPELPAPPPGVRIEQNVPYLEPGRAEKLDLYLPSSRPPGMRSPAVVMIHGGGWIGGDKAEARSFNVGTTLALNGYVCVSINYRLDEPRWPQNLYDCKNAVRFLRANAGRLGVDPERIGVIGGSAGGHLALMVAYTNGVEGLEPESPYPGVSSQVDAVVNMYGITNVLTRRKTDEQGNPTGNPSTRTALLPMRPDEDRAAWERASPVYHVSKDTVPTLILHGTADTTVDRDQATELASKLKEHGVEHQLILLDGIGHTFDLQTWARKPLPQDLRPVVIGFFEKHLK